MQQIKCGTCEHTKFFVNSFGRTSMISCCDCGASFVLGTPSKQTVQDEPEVVEELEEELEVEKPVEKPPPKQEVVVETPKPGAVKITPEQKEQLRKMQEDGGE